jgi:hypothetical protein
VAEAGARTDGVVLLDVDGVLNPQVRIDGRGDLRVSVSFDVRARVARLAEAAAIRWATTWGGRLAPQLSEALSLPISTPAIPILSTTASAQTPKLASVQRWLQRSIASGDAWAAVVWIDDRLGADAVAWAEQSDRPVRLIRPDAATGLRDEHVEEALAFLVRSSAG